MKLNIISPGELIRRTRPLGNVVATPEEVAYLNAGRPLAIAGFDGGLMYYRLGREGESVYIMNYAEWDDGYWEFYPASQEGDAN